VIAALERLERAQHAVLDIRATDRIDRAERIFERFDALRFGELVIGLEPELRDLVTRAQAHRDIELDAATLCAIDLDPRVRIATHVEQLGRDLGDPVGSLAVIERALEHRQRRDIRKRRAVHRNPADSLR